MHWLIYISILILGVVLFRHYFSMRISQIDNNQFSRNRMRYELNQDLVNLYQENRPAHRFEANMLQIISTIQVTNHIGNRWMDGNVHFINGLEKMIQFLAMARGFRYRLDIGASVFLSPIDLKDKRKTFIYLLGHALQFENEELNYISIEYVNQKVITKIET